MPLECLVTILFLRARMAGQFSCDAGDFDAELLRALARFVDFGVMQQDFGGNAADVQAGAAEKAVLFDDQCLQAPLRGADGGYIAAGPAADNRQIVLGQENLRGRGPGVLRAENKSARRGNRVHLINGSIVSQPECQHGSRGRGARGNATNSCAVRLIAVPRRRPLYLAGEASRLSGFLDTVGGGP